MRVTVLLISALAAGLGAAKAAGKEPVDWLLSGRAVLTVDQADRVIEDGAIAWSGSRIKAVGKRAELEARYQPAHKLERPDAIVTPGLVDTHTHAPMSLFRAIADDRRLEDWLQHFIFPAEAKNVTRDFVRWGTRLACLEMVLAGITTYTDMYYFEGDEAEVAREVGVRGVLGQSVIGFPAPDHRTWQESLAYTEKYFQQFEKDDLITPAVAPHSIYTTPDAALTGARQLASRYHRPLLIHLAETKKERDDAVASRGMTPTALLEKLGVLDGRVVAAHAVWMNDDDLGILARRHTGVAHCPSSNAKLASGVARVTDMLRMGIAVGLGTDGFAGSNDTADLFEEMNLASKLQKVTRGDPTVFPAKQALRAATMGGAQVLGLEDRIGSLEVGKQADIAVISVAGPDAHPLYHYDSVLVYALKAGDVADVFIAGRPIVSDRVALTLNASEVLAMADRYRNKIVLSLQ